MVSVGMFFVTMFVGVGVVGGLFRGLGILCSFVGILLLSSGCILGGVGVGIGCFGGCSGGIWGSWDSVSLVVHWF